jgi:hypothetical protein
MFYNFPNFFILRALLVERWMSCSNRKLASLNENCVPIVSTCNSPSYVLRHFHCPARYPTTRWRALNFPQHGQVNTDDGGYGSVEGDRGVTRR